jgi:plasmid stability protein
MPQILVRQLPADVKARLQRRAKRHGRSLEAEVREILCQVPEPAAASSRDAENITLQLIDRIQRIGITNEDIDALNENIAIAGRNRRTFKLDDDIA